MAPDKIEPRLAAEMARLGHQAAEPLPVLIEHAEPAHAPFEGDFADLERAVRADQQEIVDRLASLGVTRAIDQLVLANAVATELTPAQIEAVARLASVKVVRLNRPEQVTTI